MRDGIAISSEDKFNMMFGAIYKKIKNQIPKDFKETIKTANLDQNEEMFKKFSSWNNFIFISVYSFSWNNLNYLKNSQTL